MASIQTCDFVFNGESNSEHGVLLCKFSDESSSSSNDETATITTSKTYASDIFHLVNVDYEEPLKFSITLCKADGTYFTSDEQRENKKWLCRTDGYHWLHVDQEDMYDIRYNALISFAEMKDIGGKNGGMKFNVQCSSPFSYSFDKTIIKTCSNNTLDFNLYNDSDFSGADKIIYPNIKIVSNISGDIQISNTTTGDIMKFTNCSIGETITLSDAEIPSTTSDRVIIDSWNYGSIGLIDGINSITINGNCTVTFTYSCPRRVGG
jgi:hypothetical protein